MGASYRFGDNGRMAVHTSNGSTVATTTSTLTSTGLPVSINTSDGCRRLILIMKVVECEAISSERDGRGNGSGGAAQGLAATVEGGHHKESLAE